MNLIKKMLPAGLASLMIVFTVLALSTSADESDNEKHPRFNAERQEQRAEHREQMHALIETGDYNAFVEAVEDTKHGEKLLEHINEDNFPKFVEMHGHLKKAGELREELGLPQHGGKFGKHKMMKWKGGGKWKTTSE